MSSFTLDKTIFTPELYAHIRTLWFQELRPSDTSVPPSVVKRWFGGEPADKLEFDGICREAVGRALDSIGPANFASPNASPFLHEIQRIRDEEKKEGGDGSQAAETALSMVLLLDQMPRNIFRDKEGLAKVYLHYDKISYPFLTTLLSPESPIPRPDLHPNWVLSPAFRLWFFLPLVHSEDLAAHDRVDEMFAEIRRDMETGRGSQEMMFFVEKGKESEKEHRDILEKFGRYPHRNEAVGRETTEEERVFLEEGGATFGVQKGEK